MLQSTPMLSRQDSADPRACQQVDPAHAWTGAGTVDTRSLIAAVVRAYNASYHLADDVTPEAILGPARTPAVAWARHLCAYLLVEDHHLTHAAAARVFGRGDHSTSVNSRARISAALSHDTRLARVLDRARADLAGTRCDEDVRMRRDEDVRMRRDEGLRARRDADRLHAVAAATPRELAEYRYWRLRALHTGSTW